jgi:hypothetical protein
MQADSDPELELLELLVALRKGTQKGAAATRHLRECLLRVGSRSPDNLNCAEHIEIHAVRREYARPLSTQCIKVKGHDLMVADVISALECAPIPALVRKDLPSLTVAEWQACLRFVMLVLKSAEHVTPRKKFARKKRK